MAVGGEDIKARLKTLSPQQRRLLLSTLALPERRIDAIPRYPQRAELPQSYAQRRLWYLHRLDPLTSMYNMPQAARFAGALALEHLQGAFDDVLARHSALRTVFADSPAGPVQRILPAAPQPLELIDLSATDPATVEQRGLELSHAVADRPFDLERGPVARMTVIRLAAHTHLVVINMHHIVSDGWSVAILVRDMIACYQARHAGRAPALPPLPIDFSDFVQWQNQRLTGAELERQLRFWQTRLAGLEPLALPFDRAPSPQTSARGGYEMIKMEAGLRDRLVRLTAECDCTLFMALLAAFKVLLHRYSAQTDINVGVPVAGRNRLETEHLIGFFANTALVRTDLDGEPTFRQLIARVRESALGAFAHDETPLEKIVELVQPERDLARNPLFQLMFILQNTRRPALDMPGLQVQLLDTYNSTVKFDMLVEFYEADGGLTGGLGYRSDLFNSSTMAPFARAFVTVVAAMCADPDARIGDFPLGAGAAPASVAGDSFADDLE
ncbi:condensation protein [Rugamonas sp. FT82W]|uniref:Condensation protein n=1 Tax=Duganella vulcania TaxID=2692166 RepID=A0A845GFX2_9BURK|nr:condensation domain-containing protein [Duganella vulcania]MYM91737.1 condensation protein [Duganella vulcania]